MKTRLLLITLSLASSLPLMAGTQYSVVGNATDSGARSARGNLISSGGYLFGASQFGGANGQGTIFRFNPATGDYQINYHFANTTDGFNPFDGVLLASDTKLYGVNFGGANSQGTLFRIDQPGNTFETLRPFASASGGTPEGGLCQASDGKIYGVTGQGGTHGFGGIYQVNLNGSGYSLIRSFSGTTGSTRGKGGICGGLVEGPGGLLYGTTGTGGPDSNTGLFFSVSTNGITYNFMHGFEAPGLTKPSNRLLLASDGLFYGAAELGGAANKGGIFRIAPNGDYTELHQFSNDLDGHTVYSALVEGSDGYLYGCAFFSSNNHGSVFRMSKDGKSFAVLHRFTGGATDGSQPDSPLLETSNGVFFGTTVGGGGNGAGTVFKIETTLEAPMLKVLGRPRPLFRKNFLRLRGTASDDLGVVRVEYATQGAFKTAKGTTAWNARIPVKSKVSRLDVQVRSVDADALLSPVTTVRARRAK